VGFFTEGNEENEGESIWRHVTLKRIPLGLA